MASSFGEALVGAFNSTYGTISKANLQNAETQKMLDDMEGARKHREFVAELSQRNKITDSQGRLLRGDLSGASGVSGSRGVAAPPLPELSQPETQPPAASPPAAGTAPPTSGTGYTSASGAAGAAPPAGAPAAAPATGAPAAAPGRPAAPPRPPARPGTTSVPAAAPAAPAAPAVPVAGGPGQPPVPGPPPGPMPAVPGPGGQPAPPAYPPGPMPPTPEMLPVETPALVGPEAAAQPGPDVVPPVGPPRSTQVLDARVPGGQEEMQDWETDIGKALAWRPTTGAGQVQRGVVAVNQAADDWAKAADLGRAAIRRGAEEGWRRGREGRALVDTAQPTARTPQGTAAMNRFRDRALMPGIERPEDPDAPPLQQMPEGGPRRAVDPRPRPGQIGAGGGDPVPTRTEMRNGRRVKVNAITGEIIP